MDLISFMIRNRIIPFVKEWKLVNTLLRAFDIFSIALAFQCAYMLNYYKYGGFFFTDKRILALFLGILPLWLIILYLIKISDIPRTKRYRVLFFEYFQSGIAISFLLLVAYFIFKMSWISRLFLIEMTFLGFIFLFFIRFLEYQVFKSYRAKGFNYVNIVLITDDSSLQFVERLLMNKEWGYRIIAIFTDSEKIRKIYERTIIVVPEEFIKVLNDLMEVDIIDEVFYIKNKIIPSEVRNLVRSCEELGVVFRLKSEDSNKNLTNAIETTIANKKFLNFINVPHNNFALSVKRVMDINVSILMIIILCPLLFVLALIIKSTSPGPVLYKQTRVGLRGRQFKLYKFRTMINNAEQLRKDLEADNEADGPVFKIKEDPRVTRIGKILRKTGLDELPQLFNILKGEMSLIGPRPPLASETNKYRRWQLRRLSVKPGLSCFWQIKPDRNRIKFEDWMEMDLAYIDNWSLRLDFLILIKTVKTVFQRTGL